MTVKSTGEVLHSKAKGQGKCEFANERQLLFQKIRQILADRE